eukprot:TRINITY_DN2688_c0_g2_i1.p1 TRINITY_DN2688_c0_g2~~TRINITY_DN2688_c0_g2_i1.p1  ORF type:complete len:167 (+),score=32.94 TRINITY_DN2688_c0_g2_i1:31-531(+)
MQRATSRSNEQFGRSSRTAPVPAALIAPTFTVDVQSNVPAHKKRLMALEERIRDILADVNSEIAQLNETKTEAATLDRVITLRTSELEKHLREEFSRLDEFMRRNMVAKNAENTRLQDQMRTLWDEKPEVERKLREVERQVQEVEHMVGEDPVSYTHLTLPTIYSV